MAEDFEVFMRAKARSRPAWTFLRDLLGASFQPVLSPPLALAVGPTPIRCPLGADYLRQGPGDCRGEGAGSLREMRPC